jgi:hypothetical protein
MHWELLLSIISLRVRPKGSSTNNFQKTGKYGMVKE